MYSGKPPEDLVLVTGATSGFGDAIARRFVREGRRVIAAGRRRGRLHALAAELGDAVLPWPLDITDRGAVAALPEALPEGWRDVGILINNAGLALGSEPFHKNDPDWIETVVMTNVLGLARLTRAILPAMVERNAGTIVNLGSVAANYPYPGGAIYCASKAFVQQFTLALKADLAGTACASPTSSPEWSAVPSSRRCAGTTPTAPAPSTPRPGR